MWWAKALGTLLVGAAILLLIICKTGEKLGYDILVGPRTRNAILGVAKATLPSLRACAGFLGVVFGGPVGRVSMAIVNLFGDLLKTREENNDGGNDAGDANSSSPPTPNPQPQQPVGDDPGQGGTADVSPAVRQLLDGRNSPSPSTPTAQLQPPPQRPGDDPRQVDAPDLLPTVQRLLDDPNARLTVEERIDVLAACVHRGEANTRAIDGKHALVVLGNTEAGKSTFVNYLAGCTLERVRREASWIVRVAPNSVVPELAKIGHTAKSETFLPGIVASSGGHLAFCDCPGFMDSRGAEINIANAVNVRMAMVTAASVRVVILINYHSLCTGRGKGVKDMLEICAHLFGGEEHIREHADSFFVGVTHVPVGGDDEPTLEALRKKVTGTSTSELMRLLASRLFVYDAMDRPIEGAWDRLACLERMETLTPIIDGGRIFRTVLTDSDENRLVELAETICGQIHDAIAENRLGYAAARQKCLRRLSVVDHVTVERILNQVDARIAGVFQKEAIAMHRLCATHDFEAARVHLGKIQAAAAPEHFGAELAKATKLRGLEDFVTGAEARARDREEQNQRFAVALAKANADNALLQQALAERKAELERRYAEEAAVNQARLHELTRQEKAQTAGARDQMGDTLREQQRRLAKKDEELRVARQLGEKARTQELEAMHRRLEAEYAAKLADGEAELARVSNEAAEALAAQREAQEASMADLRRQLADVTQRQTAAAAEAAQATTRAAGPAQWTRMAPGPVRDAVKTLHGAERRPDALVAALRKVRDLAAESEVRRETFMAAGLADLVATAMGYHAGHAGLQEAACGAIGNLAYGSDARKEALMVSDAGELVAAAMRRHPGYAGVQEAACGAIGNLAGSSDAIREALMASDAAELVAAAMRGHAGHAGLQKAACGAIQNLAGGIDAIWKALMASDAGELVAAAMRGHAGHAGVQEAACWAIQNLACGSYVIREALMASDAGELVAAAMRGHAGHAGVQEAACWAIANLAWSSDAIREALMASDAGELVAAAMRGHEGHAGLQKAACGAIQNLAGSSDARKEALMASDAGEVVAAAMRGHAGHAGLQEAACGAIRNLALGSDARKEALMASDAGELVAAAMRGHADHAGVQEAACGAVWNLAAGSEARRRALRALDAGVFIAQAMRGHLGCKEVQRRGQGARNALRG